jgi:tripartite-type tricarboxylate transporter receptor subunit TctC
MAETRRIARRGALVAAALLAARPALAQPWRPARPLRLVLPFAPGGITDILARAIAEPLGTSLGQTVVVENRPGGGGNIAGEAVSRAPADGTTLLVASQGMTTMNSALYRALPYDPDHDFLPLAVLAKQPNFIVANPALTAGASLADLLARAKASPGTLTFGSPGVGSYAHISGELLRFMAGVELTHVPYRGSSLMLTDLIAGQLWLGLDAVATSMPHVRNGGLRALAVTSPQRNRAFPEVPTVAETLPGYDADAWYAVYAHKDTPEPILAALDGAIRAAIARPAYAQLIEDRAADPMPDSRAELLVRLHQEQRKWQDVVRRSGARAE